MWMLEARLSAFLAAAERALVPTSVPAETARARRSSSLCSKRWWRRWTFLAGSATAVWGRMSSKSFSAPTCSAPRGCTILAPWRTRWRSLTWPPRSAISCMASPTIRWRSTRWDQRRRQSKSRSCAGCWTRSVSPRPRRAACSPTVVRWPTSPRCSQPGPTPHRRRSSQECPPIWRSLPPVGALFDRPCGGDPGPGRSRRGAAGDRCLRAHRPGTDRCRDRARRPTRTPSVRTGGRGLRDVHWPA